MVFWYFIVLKICSLIDVKLKQHTSFFLNQISNRNATNALAMKYICAMLHTYINYPLSSSQKGIYRT